MMFQGLPPEVLEQMMNYSSEQDKWNLAKTCRQLYNVIKPLIWKKIKITKKHLLSAHLDPTILMNLQHTQKLSLVTKLDHSIHTDCIRYGFNMSRVLNAINPMKLHTLTLKGVCGDSLLYSMKDLVSLQNLQLHHIENVEASSWNHACLPAGLKMLGVVSCSVSNEFIQAVVRRCKVLESLFIFECNKLTEASLVALREAMNLRFLGIYKMGSPGYKLDVSPLVDIPNLEDLRINGVGMADNSFAFLLKECSTLTGLEIVDLEITAQEFHGIHKLQNLTEISVQQCPAIKGLTFMAAISSLEELETISFDVEMFSGIAIPNNIRGILSPLNGIASLETINISYDQGKYADTCLQIVASLCWGEEAKWKIKVNKSGKTHVLTLTKE